MIIWITLELRSDDDQAFQFIKNTVYTIKFLYSHSITATFFNKKSRKTNLES